MSRFTIGDLSKRTKIDAGKIAFAAKYCGLEIAPPRSKTARQYNNDDLRRVVEWFADRENFRAVHGYHPELCMR